MKYGVVIPVYRNFESLPDLLRQLTAINGKLDGQMEVVFVVDGSPDKSWQYLSENISACPFTVQLILLSRNFGSFSAIRAGLDHIRAEFSAVIAADLQEPPELMLEFFKILERDEADVVVGFREARNDKWKDKLFASAFWGFYRRYVQPDMPAGGIDVFGCNRKFREAIVQLRELNTSLVGLIIWLGFRRREVGYTRLERQHGTSAWVFKKKLRYMADSIFTFSDLPIRVLLFGGILGFCCSFLFTVIVIIAKLSGSINVPGYAATVILLSFFAGLNALGFGIMGSYLWRTFENSRGRPPYVLLSNHLSVSKENEL